MRNPLSDFLAPHLGTLRQAWDQRDQREQRLIAVGGLALLLTVLYLAVWEPVVKAHNAAELALADARATAQRIERVAAAQPAGRNRSGTATDRSRSLLAVVNQAAQSNTIGKAPERLTPDGEDAVRVWFEAVEFGKLLRWLAEVENRGNLILKSADIEREDPGAANARLEITRSS